MDMGDLGATRLFGSRANFSALGLGRLVDLPITGVAPDDPQYWTTATARNAGFVSNFNTLPRGIRADYVFAQSPVWPAGAAHRIQMIGPMRIAYLINQYPKISHSFIRREIQALERRGVEIVRIALRGWDAELVDADDRAERDRTRYVLRDGLSALLLAVARMLVRHPVRLVRALHLAWRMSRCAERPLPVHLAYVAEACRIEPWLRNAGVEHVHAHFGTNSAEVAMLVHVLGGPPWSFTAHGTETFDNPRLVGLTEKVLRCAFVVAVSSYGRAQIYRSVDPRHWRKVHLVRCGLDRQLSRCTDHHGCLPAAVCLRGPAQCGEGAYPPS